MPAPMRSVILAAARSTHVKTAVQRAPVSRNVVARFVAGEDIEHAVAVSRSLTADGLSVSLDQLGEDTTDRAQATAATEANLALLAALTDGGLSGVEISLKLTSLGLEIDRNLALDNALRVVAAAKAAGTTITIDMEDHTRTEQTLLSVVELRRTEPSVGAVVQAYLRRTEGDCRDLAGPGSRVRLCKGAYAEPAPVAYQQRGDVSASYLRCLEILMQGGGYPMVATHDPALIAAADGYPRAPASFEFQMLYGIRPQEQRRLAADGHTVRVYVPFGKDWYGYLMRRLAERPANLIFFARSLVTRT